MTARAMPTCVPSGAYRPATSEFANDRSTTSRGAPGDQYVIHGDVTVGGRQLHSYGFGFGFGGPGGLVVGGGLGGGGLGVAFGVAFGGFGATYGVPSEG